MEFEYRIKGQVGLGFIIRGKYFKSGENVDILAYANEVSVLRDLLQNASVSKISKSESPLPVQNEPKNEPQNEVKKNVGRPKGTSNSKN